MGEMLISCLSRSSHDRPRASPITVSTRDKFKILSCWAFPATAGYALLSEFTFNVHSQLYVQVQLIHLTKKRAVRRQLPAPLWIPKA